MDEDGFWAVVDRARAGGEAARANPSRRSLPHADFQRELPRLSQLVAPQRSGGGLSGLLRRFGTGGR